MYPPKESKAMRIAVIKEALQGVLRVGDQGWNVRVVACVTIEEAWSEGPHTDPAPSQHIFREMRVDSTCSTIGR